MKRHLRTFLVGLWEENPIFRQVYAGHCATSWILTRICIVGKAVISRLSIVLQRSLAGTTMLVRKRVEAQVARAITESTYNTAA